MRRIAGYFLVGYLFVLIQSALWPALLSWSVKPDLLLMLIVYMGLRESPLRGALLTCLLGACIDAMAGSHPGLHGVTLLIVFFSVRIVADHFNTESPLLLLFMVGAGTLLHAGLQVLFTAVADAGMVWWQILRAVVPQLLLNLLVGLFLLRLVPRISRRGVPCTDLTGQNRLDRRYGT